MFAYCPTCQRTEQPVAWDCLVIWFNGLHNVPVIVPQCGTLGKGGQSRAQKHETPHFRLGDASRIIHSAAGGDASGSWDAASSVSFPIFQTTTFGFSSPEQAAELAGATHPSNCYTRYGNPNLQVVEQALADLEGGEAALAVGSGMGAISLVFLGLLRQGDHVVAQETHYAATMSLLRDRLPAIGIEVAEEVASVAASRGHRCVGVLGTLSLMEGTVYTSKLGARGIAHRIPELDERREIDRRIFDELVYGNFTTETRQYFIRVVGRLKERGCDSVVLGCTEIPLLVTGSDLPVPALDSTRLLARAALRYAI